MKLEKKKVASLNDSCIESKKLDWFIFLDVHFAYYMEWKDIIYVKRSRLIVQKEYTLFTIFHSYNCSHRCTSHLPCDSFIFCKHPNVVCHATYTPFTS